MSGIAVLGTLGKLSRASSKENSKKQDTSSRWRLPEGHRLEEELEDEKDVGPELHPADDRRVGREDVRDAVHVDCEGDARQQRSNPRQNLAPTCAVCQFDTGDTEEHADGIHTQDVATCYVPGTSYSSVCFIDLMLCLCWMSWTRYLEGRARD
eukprot:2063758-Rhodomonas_salina.3